MTLIEISKKYIDEKKQITDSEMDPQQKKRTRIYY